MRLYPKGDALVLEIEPWEALDIIGALAVEVRDLRAIGTGAPLLYTVDATDGAGTTRAKFIIQVVSQRSAT